MANTLKLGAGKWATGTDTVLAFNDENNNFKPLPFSFSRASSATVVNQSGLIETVGSGTPRIDFLDNTKGALLLEPTRTNILLNSDNGSSYGVYSATKTLDEVISLDGTLNSFTLNGNGDTNQVLGYSSNKTLNAGDYTFSVFAKKGTNDFIHLFFDGFSGSLNSEAYFDLENGTTTTSGASIENYGNGWYRCSFVGTVVSGDLYGRFGFRASYTSSNFFFPTANDANGKKVYFYGFQVEQGSYATSYIPTSGSAVTRVADSCNQTVPSGIIGQTEGSVFFDLNTTLKNYSVISISDGTNANRVVFYFSAVLNQIASYITKSNVNSSTILSIVNSYPNSNYKVVIKYNSIGFYIFANGGLIGTILSNYSFPNNTLNEIKLSSPDNSNFFEGKVKNIKVYNQSLTDSEAIALTTI